jgi:hypothetical protein
MAGIKKRRLLFSILLGVLVMALLNVLMYAGLSSDLSIPSGLGFLLYAVLWAPLPTFSQGGQAPAVLVAAVALFDLTIITSLIYSLLSRRGRQT